MTTIQITLDDQIHISTFIIDSRFTDLIICLLKRLEKEDNE